MNVVASTGEAEWGLVRNVGVARDVEGAQRGWARRSRGPPTVRQSGAGGWRGDAATSETSGEIFDGGCSREWRDGGDVEVSKPVGPIRLAGLGSHDGLLASEHYGFLCSY